ncbi:D-alanyl-D-alanine carboxypeptidase/D-alanyl-D-alanine-endopeptidase [Mycobacterium sp. CVI_P3]|uniref:D-alanyl-D-alanine carboxypeptidase/D-alanyl-D-alanine-endopeptidase n=1 Tax=Mycobacterium pinniadriaticum TaxID=2994102 RepID=A0ABT3S6V9_9MYCO|nr:D-alanyl-D-alanine carboxypeptidase/D-alanyl-D-alanine-endopeptidase [Mycobacterium pinniadriaticum]MCX2929036.1 D-alanyl-D-alanine carboxypeptidase/D-alanyl-D-alanine-endopeptidase [Mycobacterium pinniadriaticum]MCX2935097.1 D-alanyl-D-alanine carboxypeptidase/D-alanyl-D-alanine-endopeptidase [Mycobacterium pinniadriaticum]
MRPTRWRHSTHVVLAVAVMALVAALVAAGAFLTRGGDTSSAQAPPAHPLVTANPGVIPVADAAPVPTAAGMTAALAAPVADPNLGNVTGRITDAQTGRQIWEHRSDLPLLPASTNKVLTTGAALLTLDRDERVTTTVVAADQTRQPGVVVLVGGGDPVLSAAPPGQQTWYRGAARISDLADQVRKSGITATAVQVDVSLFTGPDFAPGWDPADIEGGDIAPIQPVMIDAGRTQPTTVDSARSKTPALDAGRALASALGVDPAKVTLAAAPPTGRQLASVQSAPLIERLRQMMNASDNVMAESIGREVAKASGRPVSFAGAVDAVTSHLAGVGVDMTGAALVDSSGLSLLDRLTAKTLDEVVNAAAGPDLPAMRPLLDLLPIAGGSGTLSDRFLGGDPKQSSAGWLRAKTGSLTAVNSLAGIVTDANGRVLTFAFISNDAGPTGRVALDTLAGVLRTCGCGS